MTCNATLAEAAPGKTVLGFVGIGIMGLAMTRNLIKAGYEVVVWNRNPEKCKPLEQEGARVASSPRDVVSAATYTFAMLSDPEAALDVALRPDGVVAGISPGKGYIDVSTVDAATSRTIAAAVRSAGGGFLEAPVSGSKGPAEQGKLIFLTAGDEDLFAAVSAPLDVMGKAKFFLGPEGAGAHMKLVVNMVMGAMMTSFAEGLALADKVGLKHQDVIDVVALGAIAAPMFALKGPAMAARSYNPAFPLKHQQKDMRLALALGDEVAQPLPMAAAANSLYIAARRQGLGDMDFSAVMEAVAAQEADTKKQ
ncbi:6-phosphogluconate dehydrogenase [Volvox carteri f. nagariensis]|uniref:6-phosphogluconate dehydrogenase n=1 Tax=Volvox carteri f. nagariensis TaxID=3068 RepID=D8THP7_VOLCA|nr:6-phosphogluconate dehydrogenase [Volvox carteri f. nagariensis]EFJ53105.1 6-phosphogluconate dehydrogenase [Volvox carteri f. nagariensis]|eukprot:XP_002946110.1 6-phosphogluconate dehydrogenase [Volvox carteri f. nagariensis]